MAAAPKRPRVERLALSYFNQMLNRAPLTRTEAAMEAAMVPGWSPDDQEGGWWPLTESLLRTCQAFVLARPEFEEVVRAWAFESGFETGDVDDGDDLVLKLGSYDTMESEIGRELRMSMLGFDRPGTYARVGCHPLDAIGGDLPPLPFPRVAIEVWDETDETPFGLYADATSVMPLVLISERVPGRTWDICCLLSTLMHPNPATRAPNFAEEFYREQALGEPGLFTFTMNAWEEPVNLDEVQLPAEQDEMFGTVIDPDKAAAIYWRRIVFNLVDLITVENAAREPVPIPRGHRRGFERKHGIAHPSVYFVDLRAAGEQRVGVSDREYHCRWIVRGHWRHYRRAGRRVWIKPYIKGAVGAPFKGRPIYTTVGSEEA